MEKSKMKRVKAIVTGSLLIFLILFIYDVMNGQPENGFALLPSVGVLLFLYFGVKRRLKQNNA